MPETIPPPFLEERRQAILGRIQMTGRVAVAELSAMFGVSEVTIRADLQALAEQNLLVRTHGGAVPAVNGINEMALFLRRERQVIEKSRIGTTAAGFVADGDALYLDSSSTSLAIAHHLRPRRHVTVVTNSLEVTRVLYDAAGVELVMLGGALQRTTASLVGGYGLANLEAFNLEKGFFGAHGISLEAGLTDVSTDEAAVKRPLAARCRQVFAVLDATKWGRIGVASFAALSQITTVITDTAAPAHLVAAVKALEIDVILV
ncbi:MAG: DeoR/GlpR transcriptional regulator [Anaerolineales bacterium]|nr:DeoR/GlpR transcriptional regulator [Anaerolineales bacterium]